mgnify:CR=1 FL=1
MSTSAGRNVFKRHRRGELAGADQAARDVVDLLMDRLEEMRRLEKIADAVERLVVDEDGTQKRLLRLDVVRCGAVGRRRMLSACLRAVRSSGAMMFGADRFQSVDKSGALTPRAELKATVRLLLSPLLTARK